MRRRPGVSFVLAGGVLLGALCSCSAPNDTVGIITSAAPAEPDSEGCVPGGTLKHRPETAPVTLLESDYEGDNALAWPLLRRGQFVTLEGQGYLNLRWQIEYASKAGVITPPGIALTTGTLVHVGGGGGKNLGDPRPGTNGTWLGNAEEGLSVMADGVKTPWQNEFYYLDGQVTITQFETDGLYNITVSAQTYDEVVSPDWGVYDPGVVCDLE